MLIDSERYASKPKGKEVGLISNRIIDGHAIMTTQELAHKIADGYSFSPAIFDGKRSRENWIKQQLFALDFDNDTSLNDFFDAASRYAILPFCVYATYNRSETKERFRPVFCVSEPIINIELRDLIQLCLMRIFPGCDTSCKDAARFYFGGTSLIAENSNAVMDVQRLIAACFPDLPENYSLTDTHIKELLARLDNNVNEKTTDDDKCEEADIVADDSPGKEKNVWKEFKHDVSLSLTDAHLAEIFLLTGKSKGEWLEARDPSSPSGDLNPSAGVADGTGEFPRGLFKSFRGDGQAINVVDYVRQYKDCKDFVDAARYLSRLTGAPLPINDLPARLLKRVDVHNWNRTYPSPPDWIIPGVLSRGMVGGLVGTGGIGKGFLVLQLLMGAAAGKTIFPSFPIIKPNRVMYLAAEDSSDQLHRRYRTILDAYDFSDEEMALLEKNFCLFSDCDGPLVTSGKKSVLITQRYKELKGEMLNFGPDLIVIDPKSRWTAINEDNNSEQALFIRSIERLIRISYGSALIVHHTGKNGRNEMDDSRARGASAFTHSIRVQMNVVYAVTREIVALGHTHSGESDRQYIKLDITKSNVSGGFKRPVFFRRMENGVLKEITENAKELAQTRTESAIVEWLNHHENVWISMSDIKSRTRNAKDLLNDLRNNIDSGITWDRLKDAVENALETHILTTKKIGKKSCIIISKNDEQVCNSATLQTDNFCAAFL